MPIQMGYGYRSDLRLLSSKPEAPAADEPPIRKTA